MNEDYKNDILTMREYLFNAVKASDQLLAVSEGAPMSSVSMQQTLERASAQFEDAVLELRKICERYCAGIGGYPRQRLIETEHPTGNVELLEGRWVHITLNKNSIPNEPRSPFVTSGVRIGTAAVTSRGFTAEDMKPVADCIWDVATDFENKKEDIDARVHELVSKYPIYE